MDLDIIAKNAKLATQKIAFASTGKKNGVLTKMVNLLKRNKDEILEANRKDLEAAEKAGVPQNILHHLILDKPKIDSMINSLKKIIDLPDPIGQIGHMEKRPNGLLVGKMHVPLGVILMIYEARPQITVNAGAFALKSGNAIILKGGKEAKRCNILLGSLWKEALNSEGLPEEAIQCISVEHEDIHSLLQLYDLIDLVIPRGGKGLIRFVVENSRIPVIKHFEGICHVYIDAGADIKKATRIALNSKLLIPQASNSMETLLISEDRAEYVPEIIKAFKKEKVDIRGCKKTQALCQGIRLATEEDWSTEYLDRIISVRIVKDAHEAITHINVYGSGHTDAIVTENYTNAKRFLKEVDSAVVLVNASTMFDDGEELGMGAQIGISTDRLHARGPMGLKDLTTYKYVVMGEAHIKEK